MDENLRKELKENDLNGIQTEEKKKLTDKYGKCPVCNTELDGGDVYEGLFKLKLNHVKTASEIVKLASIFGWSESNKVRFSKLIVIEIDKKIYYKCPAIRCGVVFGGKNLFSYESLQDAIANIPLIDSVEDHKKHLEGIRDIDNMEVIPKDLKPISDMTNEEIFNYIDWLSIEYSNSDDPIYRRKIKRDYLELASWYNEETQTETFKMSL